MTEDEVGSGVEGGAHVTQATVTAGTLQTVLVPVPVQSLEHKAVHDPPVAPGADPRLPFGLERHKGDTFLLVKHHRSDGDSTPRNLHTAATTSQCPPRRSDANSRWSTQMDLDSLEGDRIKVFQLR